MVLPFGLYVISMGLTVILNRLSGSPRRLMARLISFVDRFPELVMALPDDHGGAVFLADDLIHDLDGSL